MALKTKLQYEQDRQREYDNLRPEAASEHAMPEPAGPLPVVGSGGVVGPQAKRQILRAIQLIHEADDYYGGMKILCELAGIPWKQPTATPCTLAELNAMRPNEKAQTRAD